MLTESGRTYSQDCRRILADMDLAESNIGSLQATLRGTLKDHGAAPAYLRKHGTPKRPAELVDHNCIAFNYARRLSGRSRDRKA